MQSEIRRQQRRAENADRSRRITQVATIGARDRSTGRYDLIMPDGGVLAGKGEKIYNASHNAGDAVIAVPRRDGVVLLEGPKATREPSAKENPLALPALQDRCDGYLNGQIFNCLQEKRTITIAWAIGRTDNNTNYSYALLNLITGESYALTQIPKNVPACGTPPPNAPPPQPPSPPVAPDSSWHLHVWQSWSWATPSGQVCGELPIGHPNNISIPPQSTTINLLSATDGTTWTYRIEVGSQSGGPGGATWTSASLSTYTQSSTPPTIEASYVVVSNGAGFSIFNSYLQVSNTPWVLLSGGCADLPSYGGGNPPIDYPDPNSPPVPNAVNATLSIGPDLSPIALIQHRPNCNSPGVYNFEQSYRITTNAQGQLQVKTDKGKLITDWRYGDEFACRDNFAANRFVNISTTDRAKMWEVEPNDRPVTLASNTPTPIMVSQKTIDPIANCAATLDLTKEITALSTNNVTVEVMAIAVAIVNR